MSKKPKKPKTRKKKTRYRAEHSIGVALAEREFASKRSALEEHLTRFNAADAYTALLISELWLPNLSSQVKHCFAATTFASISPDRFSPEHRIEGYDAFRDFITGVYRHLPSFPTLEDYAPEPDWGEVKSVTTTGILKAFYGGSVERITDFIDAFRMKHPSNSAPIRDLDGALAIQDHLLSSIQRSDAWTDNGWPIGSLHVPDNQFWSQVHSALPGLLQKTSQLAISPDLALHLGKPGIKRGWQEFGEAILSGTALPYALLDIGGSLFPVSPRELASVTIHYWEQRPSHPGDWVEKQVSASIASFLKPRIRHVTAGPYRIVIRDGQGERLEVPAILAHETVLYLVIVLSPERLSGLQDIERKLLSMFEHDGGVVALDIESERMVTFRQKAEAPDVRQVNLIVIATDASPEPKAIRIPRSRSHKLFLPDFISIFGSLSSIDELISYFNFVDKHKQTGLGPFTGPVDHFAAFKQSHALLADGAVEPTYISLDPHWGSNWRYEQLKMFWAAAPAAFPDDAPTSWELEPSSGSKGPLRLTGKAEPKLVWLADLKSSSLSFMLDVNAQNLEAADGQLLELFIHCIADSALQRSDLIPPGLLRWKRIVSHCVADGDHLPSQTEEDNVADDASLLTRWRTVKDSSESLELQVEVNLMLVARGATNAKDASFEAKCLAEWLAGLSRLSNQPMVDECIKAIRDSGSRAPRFIMRALPRTVDVPDHAKPLLPSPAHYKVARRDLAISFKSLGAKPGRYELAEAKAVIDPARDAYRDIVHSEISGFASSPLALFSIEQFDAAIADYDQTTARIKMSLSHDVDFDRQRKLAKLHEDFINNARNYRYLLECTLSSHSRNATIPKSDDIIKLIAKIDWLMVLYQASDTLHNETAAGGIDLSDNFVPEVFYSSDHENTYGLEMANERLGIGASEDNTSPLDELEIKQLNDAMFLDAGFTLTHLFNALAVLAQWPSANGRPNDLRLSYRARTADIVSTIVESASDLQASEAERILEFLTLDPLRIRTLSGRSVEEMDVPIWEHRKRIHRYAIRPLVRFDEHLVWGAAASRRALGIWAGTLSDGYMPADLPWRRVGAVTETVKRRIEYELEVRSFEVSGRHALHALHGIDFKSRFPNESFDDVGDFDVLAYWPDRNYWIMIECKYNKPPFCIKDARRLREHIFGKTHEGGQIAKIIRRRKFLSKNSQRLRMLLGWPAPSTNSMTMSDLYVCPRIFYWMRSPPYPIDTEFVRLDLLDAWLQSQLSS